MRIGVNNPAWFPRILSSWGLQLRKHDLQDNKDKQNQEKQKGTQSMQTIKEVDTKKKHGNKQTPSQESDTVRKKDISTTEDIEKKERN